MLPLRCLLRRSLANVSLFAYWAQTHGFSVNNSGITNDANP